MLLTQSEQKPNIRWLNVMSDVQLNKTNFLRAVRARSKENQSAFSDSLSSQHLGVAIGLLRQEIDSFVRLVYLDSVHSPDAQKLLQEFADGERWTISSGKSRVTDRTMVDIAKANYFWVEIAYTFGCKLIHLSQLADYNTTDPFQQMPPDDLNEIVGYLRQYHGYSDGDIDLPRFTVLLPNVMNKIAGKVEEYCEKLDQRVL